jgi:hypothetical protein
VTYMTTAAGPASLQPGYFPYRSERDFLAAIQSGSDVRVLLLLMGMTDGPLARVCSSDPLGARGQAGLDDRGVGRAGQGAPGPAGGTLPGP